MLRQALGSLAALAGGRTGEPDATPDHRLEVSFEQAAVGMAHVAIDGRWLRVNAQCSAITGYSKEELLGGSFQHITHPDDLPEDLTQLEKLLSGEAERYAMDKRYIRKEGGIVWVHLTVTLIRDPAGAPDFFVVVIQDISDRKHVEASLVDSEARYRAIFDSDRGDRFTRQHPVDQSRSPTHFRLCARRTGGQECAHPDAATHRGRT
jgi:PAS domain S-box-containing protein